MVDGAGEGFSGPRPPPLGGEVANRASLPNPPSRCTTLMSKGT